VRRSGTGSGRSDVIGTKRAENSTLKELGSPSGCGEEGVWKRGRRVGHRRGARVIKVGRYGGELIGCASWRLTRVLAAGDIKAEGKR